MSVQARQAAEEAARRAEEAEKAAKEKVSVEQTSSYSWYSSLFLVPETFLF